MKPDTSKSHEAQRLHPLDAIAQAELETRSSRIATVEAQLLDEPDRIELSARIENLGRTDIPADVKSNHHAETNVSKDATSRSEIPARLAALPKTNPSTGKKFSRKKWGVSCAVAIVVIAGSVFGYQSYQKSQAPKADKGVTPAVVTVSTDVARMQTVEDTLSVTGSISAWDPLSVGPEVSGLRITEIKVEEGDHVTKGQVLATLNSSLLRAQLEQAKARLHSSVANLSKAIQPNRPEDINALRAMLAQAEAAVAQEEAKRHQADASLGNAELTSHRFSELARAGAISEQDADNRKVAATNARDEVKNADERINAARSAVDHARQKLLIATRGGRSEDVQISKAAVAETKAQVQHLEQQIAQTIIRAPDDGLISRRDAHIGDITTAGTPLFAMVRMNRTELRAQVSDIDITKIHPGQLVKVTLKEDEAKPIIGKVRLVNPLVDQSTRMGVVRIDLPSDAGLKPGMFVRGEIGMGNRESVTVPVVSLVTRNNESVVFKLDKEKHAISTKVIPGIRTEEFVEIREGLSPGDVIVAKGARFLQHLDVVRIGK